MHVADARELGRNPAALLSRLISYDTTNPPGNERDCMLFLAGVLEAVGIQARLLARDEARPNLLARIPGRGEAPPLLLYGHADVVTTDDQQWTHPPFAGIVDDGMVWGRGALDMKGGVAMMLAACLRLVDSGARPPGDVLLLVVPDEEVGVGYGAQWMVERQPEQFTGVRYAIGEFGGFSFELSGRRFYPVQVCEKQKCWLRATVHGEAGHGAVRVTNGAIARAAAVLRRLDRRRLPVHVTPPARAMLESIARESPPATALVLRGLLRERLADRLLDLLGSRAAIFDPLLHNTVNPTVIRAGEKVNVIPAKVEIEMDGRLLPGFSPEDLLSELRALVGSAIDFEVTAYDPGPAHVDMGLFGTLAGVLRALDPDGAPVPLLLGATTDARYLTRLGIQSYGFTPMRLPPDFAFMNMIHAADERIPVDAVDFGTAAIERLLTRFGTAAAGEA